MIAAILVTGPEQWSVRVTILDPVAPAAAADGMAEAAVMRPATPADRQIVRDIDTRVFPAACADLEPAPAGELEQAILDQDVYLLQLHDQPVGYLHIDSRHPDHVYLSGFGVLPEFQGHRLGTAMARLAGPILRQHQGRRAIYTVTSPQNIRMLRILFGWNFAGRWALPDHFGPGRHRIGCQLLRETSPQSSRSVRIRTVPVAQSDQLMALIANGWVLRSVRHAGAEAHFELTTAGPDDFLPCPAPQFQAIF